MEKSVTDPILSFLFVLSYLIITNILSSKYCFCLHFKDVKTEIKWPSRDHTTVRWQSQDLNIAKTDPLWYWRRLLRVPWTAGRSNQSILKEISPGCSLEGLMLKLKLQYFHHLMRRADSLEKTLMLGGMGAGGEGDDRGWDGWMASPTWWTWVWVNSGSWWWTGRPGVLRFMGLQRVRHDWATELNWRQILIYVFITTIPS